ncbi:outer membrane lipoprotein-sorting protein [Lysobacter brunescens]|uniref:Outer membrane lipoprotein-sorting protein n=1 Tax=Lysobacter brunescens TaxID=262323 RepID=A0ABW2YH40_9GAMM
MLFMAAPSVSLAQDAREIMVKVDDVLNRTYRSSVRQMEFSTCRYKLSNGKLTCAEKPRNIRFEVFSTHKPIAQGGVDHKSLDVIVDPVSEKGTTMLSWIYADEDKTFDIWVYLPVLNKVKRLVAVSDGNEAAAMFGSEVSTEDSSDDRKVKDYTYKLLGQETYRGRPVWKIEMIPTEKRRKRSYYSRIVTYIDKERFNVLKDELYDPTGRLYKEWSVIEVKQFGRMWVPMRASMNNLLKRRITLVKTNAAAFDVEIDEEFHTQRSLTDFAYRERQMQLYRRSLNQGKGATPQAPAKP